MKNNHTLSQSSHVSAVAFGLKKVLRLTSAMECADGDKQDRIYFARSNGGIFSEKNKNLSARQKNF